MSVIYILEDSDERFNELLTDVRKGLSGSDSPPVVRLRSIGGRMPEEPYPAADDPAEFETDRDAARLPDDFYPVPFTRFIPKKDGTYANAREAAGAVRELIQYNYMRPDSARQYAARVHMSLTYLCRAFQRETGKSIGSYILEIRMQKAADHLAHSNLMIKEVAKAVGYTNFSYFCRRFKTFFGMTPIEYRALHRKDLSHESRTVRKRKKN